MCYSRSAWQVWADFITAAACSFANALEQNAAIRTKREKEYGECIARLGGVEIPGKMMALMVQALERNPEQDFLGDIFMLLGLGNHWKAQFFTPYAVASMMSEITYGDLEAQLAQKQWVSVNDCACGAGATLIAAANVMKRRNLNYQTKALFVAQDIDRVAGMMCYIQLSLLGCPGYVVIADSLSQPVTGSVLCPNQSPDQDFWFTPMYYHNLWQFRVLMEKMNQNTSIKEKETHHEEVRIA